MLDFETAKKDSWKSKMKLIAGLVVFFWLSLAGNRSVEANVFSTVAAGCVPDNPQTLNGGNYVTTVAGAVTFKPSLPGGTAIQFVCAIPLRISSPVHLHVVYATNALGLTAAYEKVKKLDGTASVVASVGAANSTGLVTDTSVLISDVYSSNYIYKIEISMSLSSSSSSVTVYAVYLD